MQDSSTRFCDPWLNTRRVQGWFWYVGGQVSLFVRVCTYISLPACLCLPLYVRYRDRGETGKQRQPLAVSCGDELWQLYPDSLLQQRDLGLKCDCQMRIWVPATCRAEPPARSASDVFRSCAGNAVCINVQCDRIRERAFWIWSSSAADATSFQ